MLVTRGLALIYLAVYAIQAPELETVLSRAGEYVERYERALGMVIAREVYTQTARGVSIQTDSAGVSGFGDGLSSLSPRYQRRRVLSDFLMVHLASQGDQWTGFRAVIEVDGRPVPDRLERLQEALEGRPTKHWSRGGAGSPRRAPATT
jgi:hypothetical protein